MDCGRRSWETGTRGRRADAEQRGEDGPGGGDRERGAEDEGVRPNQGIHAETGAPDSNAEEFNGVQIIALVSSVLCVPLSAGVRSL